MEALYQLHPIFEFYLTVYFAFIIAPEYFGKFLLDRVQVYIDPSQIKVVKNLDNYISKLSENEKQIMEVFDGDESSKSLCLDICKDKKEELIKLKDEIEKLALEIKQEHKEHQQKDLEKRLGQKIRDCWDNVFPFALIYCFFILVFNGCQWAYKNENQFHYLTCISYYNTICAIWLLLLIYWKKNFAKRRLFNKTTTLFFIVILKLDNSWRRVCKKEKIIEYEEKDKQYKYAYSILAITITLLISFALIPYYHFKTMGILEFQKASVLTIVSTIIIGAMPIIIFIHHVLSKVTKKYFEITYHSKIVLINESVDDGIKIINGSIESRIALKKVAK